MEGSHMYRINGKYYITCPAGGTGGWQICLRSDMFMVPYEHKLIMNDWSSYPKNGLHQGGIVLVEKWRLVVYDYAGQRTDRTCSVSCAREMDEWLAYAG